VKLNGKLISKEAIAVARSKIRYNPWEEWSSFIGKMYRDYFTALAITDKGKVYVLAIGKNNIQLQRLFVEKIVKKACFLIKEKGIEKALEEFKRDESIFKCGNNYVFVYRYVSDDKVICLYNPNYMDNIGKNMINYKTGLGYFARKIVKLKDPGFGWIKTLTKVPGGEKPQIKHIFVRYVAAQGKQYIVGAGVYYIKKD
ncbi:MAG: hypothetical protein K9L78_03810, partial [Victivallales bacterium]|nr:hypothetical protein [Victivallales bacterium]